MEPQIRTRKIVSMLRTQRVSKLIMLILSAVMLLSFTGIVYFRNAVYIYDGDNIEYGFTMLSDPHGILAEKGYQLDEYDELEIEQVGRNTMKLEIQRAYDIKVKADDKTFIIPVVNATVADVLEQCSIVVNKDDNVNYDLTEEVLPGYEIEVERAFDVSILVDGETIEVPMLEGTVEDATKKAGIVLNPDDIITPKATSLIEKGMEIEINRVTKRISSSTETIEYKTIEKLDNSLTKGLIKEEVKGKNGEKQITKEYTLIDNEVSSEKVIEEKIITDAVNRVIIKGNAPRNPVISTGAAGEIKVGKDGKPLKYSKVLTGRSTAYTAPPTGRTASGIKLEVGTVAVDPRIIPYGTKLYITSTDNKHVYGYAVAADTGGFRHEGKILVDVFMGFTEGDKYSHPNYKKACQWGNKQVNVYILED